MTASGVMTIWVRLRGIQQTIAGLNQTAASTGLLGRSVQRLSGTMERAAKRTFLMNQALFTLRRYSYMLTLGLTAGAAAIVKWGFDYNSQVQIATVAFQQFGLSAAGARKEVGFLFKQIAAPSPFQLKDIALGARRLMAFGLNVQQTNETLIGITNALTAFGITTGAYLSRATLALGHMMLLGRVSGQILFQLNRDNIPLTQALEKELHLTADQLHNIGKLGIPAGVAIQALNKYLRETPRFQHAALVFSTRTWAGIISTTRDYLAQFVGQIERPLFLNLQRRARGFLRWLTSEEVNRFAKRGDIGGVLGTINPAAERVWNLLAKDLRATWNILVHGVIPGFMYMISIVGPPLVMLLYLWSHGLEILGHHTLLAKIFFFLLSVQLGALALRFMVLLPLQTAMLAKLMLENSLKKTAIILGLAYNDVQKTQTGQIISQTVRLTKFGQIMKLIITLQFRQAAAALFGTRAWRLWTAATAGSIRINNRWVTLTKTEILIMKVRQALIMATGATKAYTIATLAAARANIIMVLTNPWFWVAAAVIGLVILYIKWKAFRDTVNSFVGWLWRHPLAAAFIPIIGPLIVAAKILERMWQLLKWIHGVFGGATRPGTAGAHTGYGAYGPRGPRHRIRGMASGGYVTSPGLSWVGERGPELAYLPAGAAVRPLGSGPGMKGIDLGNLTIYAEIHQTLEVDGEKMAQNVSKHRLDGAARR